MDPTITLESDNLGSVCDDEEEAPELPVDSRHSTPAHSSRETSRESTPRSRRRKNQKLTGLNSSPKKITSTTSLKIREIEMENLRNYQATIPSLDESIDLDVNRMAYEKNDINEDITLCENSLSQTSGYKSDDILGSSSTNENDFSKDKSSPSPSCKSNSSSTSRQRRLEEQDRFMTHTITKSDLSATTSEDTSNTIVERSIVCQIVRDENVEPNDRDADDSTPQPSDLEFLEAEAKLVLDAIRVGKEYARSRSSSADLLKPDKPSTNKSERSRSTSIEILDDDTLQHQQFDVGSCHSTLERKKLISSPGMIHRGPRISKPNESMSNVTHDNEEQGHGIRGKRKPLYSSPLKNQNRSTIPPSVPSHKPVLAPKPRNIPQGVNSASNLNSHISSPRQRASDSPPAQIRSPRTHHLRQPNTYNRKGSPPSPKISPRSIGTGSDRSYRSGASSASVTKSPLRTISPRTKSSSHITRPSPPLVRQGTFTKEEGPASSSNIPIVDIDIGETSSITSNASTSTNNSYARMSSIPISGPLKHISPGSQASNRRYTAPSRSPRSAGSQSSLDDVQRPARQSTSSSGSSIKIHQTRTSALRERSASKQGLSGRPVGEQSSIGRTTSISSASSVASSRSSKSSLKHSNSSQGLKTVAEGGRSIIPTPNKRSPSSAEIEFRRKFTSDNSQPRLSPFRNTVAGNLETNSTPESKQKNEILAKEDVASSPSTPSKKGKKDVTSKIANLWKKVEDSKKKKEKDKTNDKRVWIAKGKVIPENERALLRPHTEQQQLIDNFQKNVKVQRDQNKKAQDPQTHNESITSNTSNASNNGAKERSRSRLSIKLSKFSRSSSLLSNKRDKSRDATPKTPTGKAPIDPQTAPLATFDASLTSTEDDRTNGNSTQDFNNGSSIILPDPEASEPFTSRHFYGDESRKIIWPTRDHQTNDAVSNFSEDVSNANTSRGSVNPQSITPQQQQKGSGTGLYSRTSSIGTPASAIVQPFNYSPPVSQVSYDTHTPLKNISQQGRHLQQHAFKAPVPPSGLPRKTSNSAVRRTDSYLGSMGRRGDGLIDRAIPTSNLVVKRDRVSPNKNNDKTTGESASSMVTLM